MSLIELVDDEASTYRGSLRPHHIPMPAMARASPLPLFRQAPSVYTTTDPLDAVEVGGARAGDMKPGIGSFLTGAAVTTGADSDAGAGESPAT
jgi:hypothetical protein